SLRLRLYPDGRLRCWFWPLASKTGRCQPSNSEYIFGLPKWARNFVESPAGMGLVYADWVSQEVMIAGAVSGDDAIVRAYTTAPAVYTGIGQHPGLIPPGATKKTHPKERARCKPLVLGLLYLMSPHGLAAKMRVSLREARRIHRQLRETFPAYYRW